MERNGTKVSEDISKEVANSLVFYKNRIVLGGLVLMVSSGLAMDENLRPIGAAGAFLSTSFVVPHYVAYNRIVKNLVESGVDLSVK